MCVLCHRCHWTPLQSHFSLLLSDCGAGQLAVLVVTATWCPVCAAMRPAMQKLARDNEDVRFIAADVDIVETVAQEFDV